MENGQEMEERQGVEESREIDDVIRILAGADEERDVRGSLKVREPKGSYFVNDNSRLIIGAAIAVHKELGPGLLESAYEAALCFELEQRDIAYARQVELPVMYKSVALDCGYRIDVLIENRVILELKAVEHIQPIHEAQLMTYLRLSGAHVGFLLNFNVLLMADGIIRRVL